MNSKMIFLSIITCSYSLFGCGKSPKAKESLPPQNESKLVDPEIESLRAENARLKERAAEAEKELAALKDELQQRQTQLADSEALVERRRQELQQASTELKTSLAKLKNIEDKLAASSSANADLSSELRLVKTSIAALSEEVKSKESLLASAQAEVDQSKGEIARLEQRTLELDSFISPLVKPLQGLWQGELEVGLNAQRVCKLFYEIGGVTFKRAVVCRDASGKKFKSSFERGEFIDLFKIPSSNEVSTSLDVHRQVWVKQQKSKCTEATYPESTHTFSWSAGFDSALDVNGSDIDAPMTLLRGEAGRGTATCDQILARANRPGTEEAVAACNLFRAKDSQIEINENVGCISRNENGIVWTSFAGDIQ